MTEKVWVFEEIEYDGPTTYKLCSRKVQAYHHLIKEIKYNPTFWKVKVNFPYRTQYGVASIFEREIE